MIEITDLHKQKIIHELIENRLEIVFHKKYDEQYEGNYELGYIPITEENIVSESMTLKQSICDDEKLKFGGCIASEFKIQLLNTEDRMFDKTKLKNQWITVILYQKHPIGYDLVCSDTTICGEDTYPGEVVMTTGWYLFKGKIDSVEKSQDDPNIYEVIAYDRLATRYKKGARGPLRRLMKNNLSTPAEILALCFDDSGVYDESEFTLSEYIFRNYEWEEERNPITKGELLKNLCEVHAGFGFFDPSKNMVKLIKLQTLNEDRSNAEIYDFYESLKAEESQTELYRQILFPYGGDLAVFQAGKSTGDKSALYAPGDVYTDDFISEEDEDFDLENINYYEISDNILAWDYSAPGTAVHLQKIQSIFKELEEQQISYTPLTAVVDGRPWVEVGDNIILRTPKTNIYGEWLDENGEVTEDINSIVYDETVSIVMSRTLKGIKALTDEIEAKGEIE